MYVFQVSGLSASLTPSLAVCLCDSALFVCFCAQYQCYVRLFGAADIITQYASVYVAREYFRNVLLEEVLISFENAQRKMCVSNSQSASLKQAHSAAAVVCLCAAHIVIRTLLFHLPHAVLAHFLAFLRKTYLYACW